MSGTYTRFQTLHAIGRLINFLAYMVALAGVITAFMFLHSVGTTGSVKPVLPAVAGSFFGGLISACLMLGVGKTIHLLLAIEENTRS